MAENRYKRQRQRMFKSSQTISIDKSANRTRISADISLPNACCICHEAFASPDNESAIREMTNMSRFCANHASIGESEKEIRSATKHFLALSLSGETGELDHFRRVCIDCFHHTIESTSKRQARLTRVAIVWK